MFRIDIATKKITPLAKKTFADLHLSERGDLQEWICDYPEILGEPLLIIQKEFADFFDTNERLDLLALDKNGNLVVIENKIDDSGKDVTWQALKYVSYCAPLKKDEIRDIYQKYLGKTAQDTEEKLSEFFNNDGFENLQLNTGAQRIILVAANFRKEVTATVLWLMNYGLDIKCMRVALYQDTDVHRTYLDAEQILPLKDAGDYQVRLFAKKQEETATTKGANLYKEFWTTALPTLVEKCPAYQGKIPSSGNWMTGTNAHGVGFNVLLCKDTARVEIYIDTGSKERNKSIFNRLYEKKDDYEQDVGVPLDWQEIPDRRASRVCIINETVGLYDRDTWSDAIIWLAENIAKFYKVFKKPIDEMIKK